MKKEEERRQEEEKKRNSEGIEAFRWKREREERGGKDSTGEIMRREDERKRSKGRGCKHSDEKTQRGKFERKARQRMRRAGERNSCCCAFVSLTRLAVHDVPEVVPQQTIPDNPAKEKERMRGKRVGKDGG
jgi:hypothetical protein